MSLANADKDAMTDADFDEFASDIMGVSFTDMKSAITDKMNGNDTAFEMALEAAAQKNGTSIEHMNEIANIIMQ
ncbi:MAG: hypothetical protein R2827_11535 [Bdellovibrionales bacterium]